jgi:hypothetical protein
MTGKFNNLFNHIILSEGFFNVPDSVTSEIKKDFEDIIRFKDDEVPIKNYKLDFSNTKYEFLNELEPNPSVDVKFTKGGGRIKGSFHIASETKLKNNNALIQIDMSADTPERILSDVIEHEVSHFVQRLIKKYNEEKKGYGSLGGMPSKKLLKGLEKDKKKISIHTHVPSEMYPDLLSSIRELETVFIRKGEDISKKQFFLDFLEAVKNKKKIKNLSLAYEIFSDIKELSEELYRDFVKKAYDAFVNN